MARFFLSVEKEGERRINIMGTTGSRARGGEKMLGKE
jgi:hypothetical protein